METSLSQSELQKLADAEFEKHNVEEFYATTDGQLFYQEHFAKSHASGKLTVYHLVKSGSSKKETVKPASAKDLIALAASLEAVEVLNQMLVTEKALEAPRKSVVEAIESRISNLSE